MKGLRKILNKFIEWEKLVCILLLAVMLAVCFIQVVMRYVFNKPFAWSEEVILVLLIWFGFICMSIDIESDTHIAITGVYAKFPPSLRKTCDLIRHVLLSGFFFFMVKYGFQIYTITSKQKMSSVQWSKGWMFLPMVVGGGIMLVFSLINIVHIFVKEDSEDHAELKGGALK